MGAKSGFSYKLGSWNLSFSTSTGLIYLSQATTDSECLGARFLSFSKSARMGWAPHSDLSREQKSHIFKVFMGFIFAVVDFTKLTFASVDTKILNHHLS